MDGLSTPILFLIFNRPETTKKVFERIKIIKPKKLLLVADGPRDSHPSDVKSCAETRKIVDNVDWDCEILRCYSDVNLGCKQRVSSGISWAFEQVDEAIILEDDCLPDLTFFPFCNELLAKYRNDSRIMAITGHSYLPENNRNGNSYYFSYFHHIWGWATWKRAWSFYDIDMKNWPKLRNEKWLSDLMGNHKSAKIWENIFQASFENKVVSWDHQWGYSCLSQSGYCIIPRINLIENIGFGDNATHTFKSVKKISATKANSLYFPLKHPDFVIRDTKAEEREHTYILSPIIERVKNKLLKVFFN